MIEFWQTNKPRATLEHLYLRIAKLTGIFLTASEHRLSFLIIAFS